MYTLDVGGRTYSLCCFSQALDPAERTDRVIAEAWDAAFVLYGGTPSPNELERLSVSVPKQEAGRFESTELVLSRANRSVRAFEEVAARLARGAQPRREMLKQIGYLMRTTAVYGNGKFGIADRARIVDDPLLSAPFQAELLCVYLIREFTHDLVEHVAAARDPVRCVPIAPDLKRHLGVGNATGLGMAPFLISHPLLLNAWMTARETALARVRAMDQVLPQNVARFVDLLERAQVHVGEWQVDDARQAARIKTLLCQLGDIAALSSTVGTPDYPWDQLFRACEAFSLETQEMVVALLIELYPERVDDLAEEMATNDIARIDPAMTVGALRELAHTVFGWCKAIDVADPRARQRFWYVSEEKLEPPPWRASNGARLRP